MEREKLEKAVLQRVAGGASIEAAAKEFKVTEKLVYTWLTIAPLEKWRKMYAGAGSRGSDY